MVLRAIALSLALLVGLGAIIPLATDYSEASSKQKKKKKKKRAKYKKYSKKWWRAYNQRMKRKKALAKRRRALRLRQIRLARMMSETAKVGDASQKSKVKANKDLLTVDSTPAFLPTGDAAPKGWKRGQISSNSELQFRVDDDGGAQIGSASIAVIGPALGADNDNARNKTVGGVMTTALRGTVIDRMIKEQGWVVNDFQKEIGGKKVYVVVAQTPGAGGTIQSRMFYFTEADGKIYSVATSAPNDSAERIVRESEKVIDSLQRIKSNPQQASSSSINR